MSTLAGTRPLRRPDFVAELETQVTLFAKLQNAGANVLLDSTQPHAERGRHSFVGFADTVQWFDSTSEGLRALERSHRLQAREAGRSVSDMPFVGGLVFVGGGDGPFGVARVPTVGVLEVVSRALWLHSRRESSADEQRTKAYLKTTLEFAHRLDPLDIDPREIGAAPPWEPGSRRASRGDFDGDPFHLFRVLRVATCRPFMGFMTGHHRAVLGAGTSPMLTIRSRLVTMWVPTGPAKTTDSPEISNAREALHGVINEVVAEDDDTPVESVLLDKPLAGAQLHGARFSGRLHDGKIVVDAISAAMLSRGEHAPPVAGYLGWDGSVDTAVLDDSITLEDGSYRAVAYASGDGDGALEYAISRATK